MGFNDYEIRGNVTAIFLETRDGEKFETIIDTEDLDRIEAMDLHWHVRYNPNTGTYYAKATRRVDGLDGKLKKSSVYLNIEIMNPEYNEYVYVDHRNHDTLDNRKINLRVTDNPNNSAHRKSANFNNKTGVRNVHLITKQSGKQEYWVQIMRKGERYKWEFPLDQFDEACRCAEENRLLLFGEFAGES